MVATLVGVTQNTAGFFAVRFMLGVTESALFPGVDVLSVDVVCRHTVKTAGCAVPDMRKVGTSATNSIAAARCASALHR